MDKETSKLLFEAITKLTEKIAALEGSNDTEDTKSVLRFAKKSGNVQSSLPNYWEASRNLEAHKAKRAKFRKEQGFWGTGKASA